MNFVDYLDLSIVEERSDYVEATMEVDERVQQPFGYLHGGVTISLLETIASQGACMNAAEGELPFAVDVHVAHRNSMKMGTIRAIAKLDKQSTTSKGYKKQTWEVAAFNPEDGVVSEGTIICLIVPHQL